MNWKKTRKVTSWKLCIMTVILSMSTCKDKETKPYISNRELPSIGAVASCPDDETVTLLEALKDPQVWAHSVDAIVMAAIRNIEFAYEPAFVADSRWNGGYIDQNNCPGIVSPAIDLELEVSQSLFGSAPEFISVRIGVSELASWKPMPVPDVGGLLSWSGEGDPLVIGQTIGAALHFDPDLNMWGLRGEALFQFTNSGLEFQNIRGLSDCYAPPQPEGLSEMTLTELRTYLSTMDNPSVDILSKAEERRSAILRAEDSLLAVCFLPEGWSSSGETCDSDTDCAPNTLCINGTCQ